MQDIIKRENLEFSLVLFIAISAFIYFAWDNWNNPRVGVYYDCRIAEISPDFPPQVKEQCRKLRAENFKENLQKPK